MDIGSIDDADIALELNKTGAYCVAVVRAVTITDNVGSV